MSITCKNMLLSGLLVLVTGFGAPLCADGQDRHDYQVELYDRLHGSPKQVYWRQLAPMSVGAVYLQRPGEGEEEMRWHFRTMKKLGFTSTKQLLTTPGWSFEDAALIALEEGIIPWWYGEGGWEHITPELLEELGLPAGMDIREARSHPAMIDYQTQLMKARLLKQKQMISENGTYLPQGIPHPNTGGVGPDLPGEIMPLFFSWLREQYPDIEELNHAYNMHHVLLAPDGRPFESWEDLENRWDRLISKEYRHLRDIFRFKADMRIQWIRQNKIERHNSFDPVAPYRAGGEMGMFLPFSWRGVDMEGIADLMTPNGSFYPSIHLAWHFNEVEHEITRPVYMQASLTHDYFKGGWSATWESTGGPQQFSGGKGGNGFTVDEGTMTQLMLTYLASGYKGFGLWSWSMRTAGWEAGEFALLDRHNRLTDKAVRAGAIGMAAQKYRDEIWQAHKEPMVGIYADWENEAYWAAMSVRGRDRFRQLPIDARAGISRALINANIPFEYVTPSDLRRGLTKRYRVIYLPFVISLHPEILEILKTYAEQGGKVAMDMPSAWYDQNGALLYSEKGSRFEQLFGVTINEYQYAGVNRPYLLQGDTLYGFTVDMTPSVARIIDRYQFGPPAVTSNRIGSGEAMILGYEASLSCFKPGNRKAEKRLVDYIMGDTEPFFRCSGAIVYRIASPAADHYFLINDGEACDVTLDTEYTYENRSDAVTGEVLDPGKPISLERYSGRWIRCEKTRNEL